MGSVLLVDDEQKLRTLLSRLLKAEGFDVVVAGDCKTALRKLEQQDVDVVLCDVKLPDGDGVEFIRQIKNRFAYKECILFTAFGNVADGIRAMKNGAFDYLVKGDDDEKIIPLLFRAMEKAQMHKKIERLEARVRSGHSFSTIIGHSKKLREAVSMAQHVAPTDTGVLLLGETGTGKEVFAQAIHNASPRADQNFVAVNCSAFSKEILESELFGHRAGAFTSAHSDKRGIIEEAHKGTLFLDEISEMPLELQAKLLRVLETSEFYKVGDSTTTRIDFRLIAASNRDLKAESARGAFRSDLYYRLNVFEVKLPALRERPDDIRLLSREFIVQSCVRTNKQNMQPSEEYLLALESYSWPGNIRELRNVIERSVILSDSATLEARHLPLDIRHSESELPPDAVASTDLAIVERNHILRVLAQCDGNKSEAARMLNIGVSTLYRKLEEYQL